MLAQHDRVCHMPLPRACRNRAKILLESDQCPARADLRSAAGIYRGGTRAAEKITLWDSRLRRDSLKAFGRAFGKPSSLFIANWPVLR